MNNFRNFNRYLAQTSPQALGIEIVSASGCRLQTKNGGALIDLISGIAVSNLGHGNPQINDAIKKQLALFNHVMVYGELVQEVQVQLVTKLCELLPESLNNCFLVNSGSEAVEGAIKLCRKFTGRNKLVSFKNAYHGSTTGALSLAGGSWLKEGFGNLLSDHLLLEFNRFEDIDRIDESVAGVFVEPIQGEAGVVLPEDGFLTALKEKCQEQGALLVFDEIQTGMGRSGSLFAFEQMNVTPDVLLLAKAFGGGLPLGAFISSKDIMQSLSENPVLGHISTFGGHPLSCAAALASLEILENFDWSEVERKGALFEKLLSQRNAFMIRRKGLMLALEFGTESGLRAVIDNCLKAGLLCDWFLFAPNCFRIAPPLIISDEEIKTAANIILAATENEKA